jgi:hypothetical protein
VYPTSEYTISDYVCIMFSGPAVLSLYSLYRRVRAEPTPPQEWNMSEAGTLCAAVAAGLRFRPNLCNSNSQVASH